MFDSITSFNLKLANFIINQTGKISKEDKRFTFLSFPKCGRTWVRSLVNHYFYLLYPLSVTQDNYIYWGQKPIIRFSHLGKTLDSKTITKKLGPFKKNNNILLFRDPRDVFVSYFIHITKAGHYPDDKQIDWESVPISDVLRNETYGIKQVVNYMNSVMKTIYSEENSLLLSYEAFKADTKKEFLILLKFLGDKVLSDRAINTAIDYCSFENMQKREIEGIANEFQISTRVRKREGAESLKVRKGKVSGHLEYLSGEDLDFANSVYESLNPVLKRIISSK